MSRRMPGHVGAATFRAAIEPRDPRTGSRRMPGHVGAATASRISRRNGFFLSRRMPGHVGVATLLGGASGPSRRMPGHVGVATGGFGPPLIGPGECRAMVVLLRVRAGLPSRRMPGHVGAATRVGGEETRYSRSPGECRAVLVLLRPQPKPWQGETPVPENAGPCWCCYRLKRDSHVFRGASSRRMPGHVGAATGWWRAWPCLARGPGECRAMLVLLQGN